MAVFESLSTASYLHSTATISVSTQYTNVPASHPDVARRHRPRFCIASRGKKWRDQSANF